MRAKNAVFGLLVLNANVFGDSGSWNRSGNENWPVNGNWTGGATYPNSTTDIATFPDIGGGSTVEVYVNSPISVGGITFTNTNSPTTYNILATPGDPSLTLYGPITVNSGNNILSQAIVVPATIAINMLGTAQLQLGAISGAGGITLNGASGTVLSLAGNNSSYSGAITINGGTLLADAGLAVANLAYTVNTGTLDFGGYNTIIPSISGSGGVVTSSGNVTLTVGNFTDSTYSGTIQNGGGTLSIIKQGTGTWTLSGTNTYSGTTTINLGTLKAGSTGAFSSASEFTLSGLAVTTLDLGGYNNTISSLSGLGGTVTNSGVGAATLTVGDSADPTYSGTIQNGTGTLSIIKQGTGIWTLSGSNTYSGGTTISAGQITLASTNGLGTGSLTMEAATTLGLNNGIAATNTATLSGAATVTVATGTATLYGAVGGNGSLTKTGAGTLVLSGSNTYSGGTNLSAGQITLASTNGLGTGSLTMAAATTLGLNNGIAASNLVTLSGAATVTVATGTATLSGAVGGAGSLTKTGAGTLVLSSANTYSGGTNLSAGQITAGNNTAIGTGSLTMAAATTLGLNDGIAASNLVTLSGAATVTVATGTATLSGAVGGFGSLTKTGAGTLVLSGTNTYSGTTTISAGTLKAGSTGAFSSTSAFVVNSSTTLDLAGYSNTISSLSGTGGTVTNSGGGAATLTVGNPLNQTYSGTIQNGTGSIAITKQGTGTWTLSGTNTYSGTTTISAGTVKAGSTGAFSSTSAFVVNSSTTLDLAGYSNTISSLSGTGGTVTNSGGGAATLTVGDANNLTYSGTIQNGTGPIAITKVGSGSLTLNGNNTPSRGTTVSAGTLMVGDASHTGAILAGGVTVSSGATIAGHGTVAGPGTISGTLQPGGSIGNLTFDTTAGSVTLDSGATTSIEFNPSSSSQIIVTGSHSLVLGGTLNLIIDNGNYPASKQYTIVDASAGSYSGTFSGITGFPPGSVGLTYDPTGYVYLYYPNGSGPPGPTPTQIASDTLSGNAYSISNYLNNNASSSVIDLFTGLNDRDLQNAMNAISPSRNAFASYAAIQTLFGLSNLLTTHVDSFRVLQKPSSQQKQLAALTADSSDEISAPVCNDSENKFSSWISGFGEFAHQAALRQNPSFNYISGAVLAGLDYNLGNRNLVGGSLGYGRTHYYEAGNAGHGDTNSYVASMYGNAYIKHLYFSSAIWGVFNQTDSTRNISFPGFSAKAHADIFSWQLVPHLEIGYEFAFSWGDVIPFTSADLAISWQRGYQEHGASYFNAKQSANNSSMLRRETGVKFSERWEKSWGAIILKEKASYVYEKPYGTGTVHTSFVGTPSSFTVSAVNQSLSLGAVGLNFLVAVGKEKPIKLDFGYEGELGGSFWSNDVMLTLSKDF